MANPTPTQTCNKCGEDLPADRFYRGRKACKACCGKRAKANREAINRRNRERRAADPEKYREKARQWREANREKVSNYNREWHSSHPDKVRAYRERSALKDPSASAERARAWRLANPERFAENGRAWREANPERYRESRRERRRRRRSRERRGDAAAIRPELIEQRVAYYGGRCWICRDAPYEQMDHVKPLAAGGLHILSNLRPACAKCNRAKWQTWPYTPPE